MGNIINFKLATVGVSLILALGFAAPALAAEYDNLEIEIEIKDDSTEVEVTWEEDGEDEEESYEYDTTDLDEVYEKLADDLDLTEEEVEDAVTKIEGEEDNDDDDNDENDNDDDRGHGNDADRCDEDNPGRGWGTMKRCGDDDSRDNWKERIKNFGKSTDKEVLRGELRELLLILIDLLRAQAALKN